MVVAQLQEYTFTNAEEHDLQTQENFKLSACFNKGGKRERERKKKNVKKEGRKESKKRKEREKRKKKQKNKRRKNGKQKEHLFYLQGNGKSTPTSNQTAKACCYSVVDCVQSTMAIFFLML